MARRAALLLWAAAAVAAVTWPFLLPGALAWRDMSVPAHMGLTAANFGAGDLPARNVPQDAVLALASALVPAHLVVKALMVSGACAAAGAAACLSRGASLPLRLAAMWLGVANPFVIERLLQGHWSLVLAAWMVLVIAAAGQATTWHWLRWPALWIASLTPTGWLLGLTAALVAGRRRGVVLGAGVVLALPWLVPSVVAASASVGDAAAGVAAFGPRAEGGVGTLGAILGLGGLWNSAAIPGSRAAGFALFGLVVCAAVAASWARAFDRWAALALVALGAVVAAWLLPGQLAWAVDHVPGAALLRDSTKLLALAVPGYVLGLARVPRFGWAVFACVLLALPDAPQSLAPLRPGPEQVDARLVARLDGRDTFFLDRPGLLADATVDPYSKATSMVVSGELVVGGRVIDPAAPRYLAAREAAATCDVETLEKLGIGAVVSAGQVVCETAAPARPVPWLLTAVWLLAPIIGLLLAALRNARR